MVRLSMNRILEETTQDEEKYENCSRQLEWCLLTKVKDFENHAHHPSPPSNTFTKRL